VHIVIDHSAIPVNRMLQQYLIMIHPIIISLNLHGNKSIHYSNI
jgi:hypothetical protein